MNIESVRPKASSKLQVLLNHWTNPVRFAGSAESAVIQQYFFFIINQRTILSATIIQRNEQGESSSKFVVVMLLVFPFSIKIRILLRFRRRASVSGHWWEYLLYSSGSCPVSLCYIYWSIQLGLFKQNIRNSSTNSMFLKSLAIIC
jgi:hypothetical protein